jgi:NADPH:quinone reductase-like Zn-dependent oxidoreductase
VPHVRPSVHGPDTKFFERFYPTGHDLIGGVRASLKNNETHVRSPSSLLVMGNTMKAMQVNNTSGGSPLVAVDLPRPEPREGELLIRVHATGVTPTELHWYPTTQQKDGTPRPSAVPGHEFSGVVAALGKNTAGFTAAQQIYGMSDWFADGATADYCVTVPQSIAPKPATLSYDEAATVPIGALTAWQGLFDHARLQSGERVLVHGGAGSVGIFAVQLAHLHGAHVIATVSDTNAKLVAELGANEVIDYKTSRFEDRIQKVDVVLDSVGGDTLDRSWSVLNPGGRLVTIASGLPENAEQRVKDAFFIVEPNQEQLLEIAKLLDTGKLKTFVNAVVPFSEASNAYSGAVRNKRGYGKVVIALQPEPTT